MEACDDRIPITLEPSLRWSRSLFSRRFEPQSIGPPISARKSLALLSQRAPAPSANPKGIPSFSPRLPSLQGYLGSLVQSGTTPTGLRSSRPGNRRNPVGVGDSSDSGSQGSSCLATAGLNAAAPLGQSEQSPQPVPA